MSKYSKEKYLSDVIAWNVDKMISGIDADVANDIRYKQRISINGATLRPELGSSDNMFTQIIKSILYDKNMSIIDLIDISGLSENIIESYYSALTKIAFMRLERWNIWINQIFKLSYKLTIRNSNRNLLIYDYPNNIFDCGDEYPDIINSKDDPFKKAVKIIIEKENITKESLRSEEHDDYTINNIMSTITTNKTLSAQLFSRFMKMANLNYIMEMYEDNKLIFTYNG